MTVSLPLAAVGTALAVKAHTISKFDARPYLTSKDAWFLPDYPHVQRYNRNSNGLRTLEEMRRVLEPGLTAAFAAVYGSGGE